jgi:hypothetical protein
MQTLTDDQLQAIRDILFNTPPRTEEALTNWRGTLFEQYKLYVEMSDKVSERRNNANSFFLTANTLLITIFGGLVALQSEPRGNPAFSPAQLRENPAFLVVAIAAAVAGIALCITWVLLITRYKNLNGQKFVIIHQLEEHLPAKPYTAEENVPSGRFKRLSSTERLIPSVFTLLYLSVIIGLIATFVTGLTAR